MNLSYCKFKDYELAYLSTLSNLTDLNLRSVADVFCEHLPKSLKYLNLHDSLNYNGQLEFISRLQNLKHLDLSDCRELNDAGLEYLSALMNLKGLDLHWSGSFTHRGLQYLPKKIEILNLGACTNIGDEGLKHLSQLTHLTSLNLYGCNITDAGLKTLPSSLKEVNLFDCYNITVKGIVELKQKNVRVFDRDSMDKTRGSMVRWNSRKGV